MGELINITEFTKDKDGPWFVFEDPISESVHVVPMGLLEGWFTGEVKIDKPEHFEVIRAILLEWYEFKFPGNDL